MTTKAEQLVAAIKGLLLQSGLPQDLSETRRLLDTDHRKKGNPTGDIAYTALTSCLDAVGSPVHIEADLRASLLGLISLAHPDTTPKSLRHHRTRVRDAQKRATTARDMKAIVYCDAALAALDALLD